MVRAFEISAGIVLVLSGISNLYLENWRPNVWVFLNLGLATLLIRLALTP